MNFDFVRTPFEETSADVFPIVDVEAFISLYVTPDVGALLSLPTLMYFVTL